jgi:hypothetical protein
VQGNLSATGTISGNGAGLTGVPSTKWVMPITNGLTLFLVPTSIVATNNGTNVIQWTDMSGSGNNFVMPALANQPMQLGSGDSASVYWPVGNSAYLTNGTLALNSTNFTMLFVFSSDAAYAEGVLFQATGNNPTFYNLNLNSNFSDFVMTSGGGNYASSNLLSSVNLQLGGAIVSPAQANLIDGEQSAAVPLLPHVTPIGGQLGAFNGSTNHNGRVACVMAWNRPLSWPEYEEVRKWTYRNFNLQPSIYHIICAGDSKTEGYHATWNGGYPSLLAEDSRLKVENFGIPGTTAAQWYSVYLNYILRAINTNMFSKNVVIWNAGINDVPLGTSSVQIWAYDTNMANLVHTNGGKIIVTTITYTGTNADDLVITNLNNIIQTNWPGVFDNWVNLNADPRIGQGSLGGANPYFFDSFNENNGGYEIELPIYRAALQKVLTP